MPWNDCIYRKMKSDKQHLNLSVFLTISIDKNKSMINVINFIDQSIEIDTHNHRCLFKILNLSIYRFYRFH